MIYQFALWAALTAVVFTFAGVHNDTVAYNYNKLTYRPYIVSILIAVIIAACAY